VVAHRPAHFRPGEHPAVRSRKPFEKRAETETPARACPPATGQVKHIATVLFRAHHKRRGVRPVQILVAAESRAHPGYGVARHRHRRPVNATTDIIL